MITKPTLILDKQKCHTNIKNMFNHAKKHNLELRPHFKTHQSLEIGQWFKNIGVSKITVSSLEMAEYFSNDWNDITVAFPINILEINTINKLAQKVQLNVLLESKEVVLFLSKNLKHKVNYFIKINVGNNRAGLLYSDAESIENILTSTKDSIHLNFKGFLGHAGQTYACRGKEEVIEAHQKSMSKLVRLKQIFKARYPNLILSYGDTPSCSIAEDFLELDEIRPGNFVFYDLMQVQIGACTYNNIAVAMACPIVAIHKDISEMVIYGGGIHFSKDRIEENGKIIFGKVAHNHGMHWKDIIPNMYVKALSQEHGVVSVSKTEIGNYNIGDIIYVLPVHSCMTADLMKHYKTIDGEDINMMTAY